MCLGSTVPNRNSPQHPSPFVQSPSNGTLATDMQSHAKFKATKRSSHGIVQFDDDVIGGKVVDGEEGVGHASLIGWMSIAVSSIRPGPSNVALQRFVAITAQFVAHVR